MRRLAFLGSLLSCACSSETSVLLRVQLDDCSIDPDRIGELVFFIEPLDGTELAGLAGLDRVEDGVRISGIDVDADDRLELVLVATRADHDLRDGFAIRVVTEEALRGTLLAQVVAGDDLGRQIGGLGEGGSPSFELREGETVTVDLHVACLCRGMDGCGGSCPDADDGCRPDRDRERFCQDGLNNDADPYADCSDSECFFRGPCAACEPEVCDDDLDDDCDGAVDCGDGDCVEDVACLDLLDEACTNGADDDRDTLLDCLDPDCEQDPACTDPCNDPRSEICDNRIDDDCDHLIDCADSDDPDGPDGQEPPDCVPPASEARCADGFDDDCDDRVDCDDFDCYETDDCDAQPCVEQAGEERLAPDGCHDAADNDCDGPIDCDDPDCGQIAEDCADRRDNDCDGQNNCADDDCPTTQIEICDDYWDNDCNGFRDCEDPDCQDLGIAESDCSDLADNDCDGSKDCDDEDCEATAECTGTHSSAAR